MVKEAYKIVVVKVLNDASIVNVVDDKSNVVDSFELADAIFEAVEKRGFDCNGCGIEWKYNRE